jgi:cyclopropane fatty-acyl-phospholipid synthase-like methyltransferase
MIWLKRRWNMLGVPRLVYDLLYRFSKPRWDNGKIPPELVAFTEIEGKQGRALDLGCGTGTQSLYLAQHGWNVVGIDLAPKAIELARQKASTMTTAVDFRVSDVTRLEFLREPFDLVIDVGCFHGLGAAEHRRYAQNLARLTHSGSLFLLYAFDHHGAFGVGVSRDEITNLFEPQFAIRQVTPGTYLGGRASFCYRLDRL